MGVCSLSVYWTLNILEYLYQERILEYIGIYILALNYSQSGNGLIKFVLTCNLKVKSQCIISAL